ncbi:MAG: DUF2235 domain-containing protein [Marinilabiliaceae bacterium]|nr:DUF2235 domain-containing protein [Marinilabiliaceae bacterium]
MGTNYNSFVYDQKDEKQGQDGKTFVNFTFGIFFDGTQNNKYNVAAREDNPAVYDDYSNNDDDSYTNDSTNVERLFKGYTFDNNAIFRIYIEGPGTTTTIKTVNGIETIKYGSDDFNGKAFGQLEYGIRARVRQACEAVADKIPKISDNTIIKSLTFDVFGFSRGAAAARNFVHEVTRLDGISYDFGAKNIENQIYSYNNTSKYGFLGFFLKNKIAFEKINKIAIKIRFVGLFDTVSSYQPNFSNDVAQLNLNSVNTNGQKVVHLIAANEHRKNFALTHIQPSLENDLPNVARKRVELSFPGVHSDIGGGYKNNEIEKRQIQDYDNPTSYRRDADLQNKLEKEWQQLLDQGWYTGNDTHEITYNNELIAIRTQIDNRYTYVPLFIMHRFVSSLKSDIIKETSLDEYTIKKPKAAKQAEITTFIKAYFDTNWLPHWKKQDKEQSVSPAYSNFPQTLVHRKSELTDTIALNLNMNRNQKSEFCPDNDEVLWFAKQRLDDFAFNNGPAFDFQTAAQILTRHGFKTNDDYRAANIEGKLPQIIESIVEQIFLRRLRNRFLHWSAQYGTTGGAMAPAPNRQRINY